MGSNEGHTAKPDNQGNYEAAVLEFLDKEMAAVKPAARQNDQADELDALVSDLLKQVITESDHPKDIRGEPAEVSEEESLLAEFPPKEVETSAPISTLEPPVPTPPPPIEKGVIAKPEEEAPEVQASTIPPTPAFAPPTATKRRIPMMAIAAAFLVAIIGTGVYYFFFSSSPKSIPGVAESQSDATVPSAPEAKNQAVPASAQTGSNAEARRLTQQAVDKTSALAQSPIQSPAVSGQKPAGSNEEPSPAPVSQAVTPAKAHPEPVQSLPAVKPVVPMANNGERQAMDKPTVAQTNPPINSSAPAVVVPSAAVEKPTTTPDVTAQEKRPALPAPVATSGIENSAPVSQPPVQSPVTSRTLIPAVAISQVSPTYPELAVRSRTSATIVLDLQIDAQGKVVKATPVSGPVIFHNAAISAVMKWRYKPASIGGTNVASQSRITLNFSLKK